MSEEKAEAALAAAREQAMRGTSQVQKVVVGEFGHDAPQFSSCALSSAVQAVLVEKV